MYAVEEPISGLEKWGQAINSHIAWLKRDLWICGSVGDEFLKSRYSFLRDLFSVQSEHVKDFSRCLDFLVLTSPAPQLPHMGYTKVLVL